jgi:hypothetical protein
MENKISTNVSRNLINCHLSTGKNFFWDIMCDKKIRSCYFIRVNPCKHHYITLHHNCNYMSEEQGQHHCYRKTTTIKELHL